VSSGGAVITSEEPTLALNEWVGDITTQRLDPRATSPGRGSLKNPIASSQPAGSLGGQAMPSRRKSLPTFLVGGAVFVIVIAIISTVAFFRLGSQGLTADNAELIYPGARTVVDMTSDEGRAIQLQTADSLDQVLAWYQGSIKPTKTMRLTSTSFVLRNQNVTATIATENNKTNILIKQSITP
jgi:hypothetical protein